MYETLNFEYKLAPKATNTNHQVSNTKYMFRMWKNNKKCSFFDFNIVVRKVENEYNNPV